MTRPGARLALRIIGVWLALLTCVVIGVAVLGEPDDGVMSAGTWASKALLALMAAFLGWGAIGLVSLRARARWVAVGSLGVFALLSGTSAVENVTRGALSDRVSGAAEVWLNVAICLVCTASIAIVSRKSTWRAVDERAW